MKTHAELKYKCEWCESIATYRIHLKMLPSYERYSCTPHINKTERLVQLDNGDALVVRTSEKDGFRVPGERP